MVGVVTLLATSVVMAAATSDSGGRFCVVLGIEELEEAVLRFPVLLISRGHMYLREEWRRRTNQKDYILVQAQACAVRVGSRNSMDSRGKSSLLYP